MDPEDTNFLHKSKSTHQSKIMELLQQHPDGLELNELNKKHAEIANETRRLFQTEIRHKGKNYQSVEILTSCQAFVNEWYRYLVDTNAQNLRNTMEQGQREKDED